MTDIREKLGKELLFFDGAMGTMLQKNGLKTGEMPENLNLTNPDLIYGIHKAYLEAGCNIIKANTFGANSLKFDNTEEIIKAGLEIAGKAAREYNAYTALDLGPTGKLLEPIGELSFEKAYELYKEEVIAGRDMCDLVLIETMGDLYEIKAAVLAAKENCSLPICVTMIFGDNGRLLTGADVKTAVITLEALGVDAVGFNCGFGPAQILPLVREAVKYTSLPIAVNPNAGLPEVINGITVYNIPTEEFADRMREITEAGAALIGGCCGTNPDYIKAEINACKDIEIREREKINFTAVTSYSKTVFFDRKTVLIGERINPTGKKRFKEALRENDINYILNEGITQADNQADILDVNVGLPEIDEEAMLVSCVKGLQAVTDLPLQLDTSDISALEHALRIYNGKAMINSVNGKKESMQSVLPLAKKYGGLVVCLLLDENGIPETAEGRIRIAEKIIKKAEDCGIDRSQLIFDALAMTVSTDENAANVTLETIRRLNDEMKVKTVLGVSNVSFGLPQRENVTSEFFVLAMNAGLSAGIINPGSNKLMTSYRAYNALKGLDTGCTEYINSITSTPENMNTTPQNTEKTLYDCILRGMKQDAGEIAEIRIKTTDPFDIIDNDIIAALNTAGKGFEEKTVFLPQLLMCAEAAKAVFEVIKKNMPQNKEASKGRIVIATVKNDIHDIGKNIVKTLLENYGFDVIDLGKDVDPVLIAETVKENKIKLVGLSALMTTTVPFMEETIKEIRKVSNDCKIMVGGAVLTQKYADMINADHYSRDAMDSVRYACEIFEN